MFNSARSTADIAGDQEPSVSHQLSQELAEALQKCADLQQQLDARGAENHVQREIPAGHLDIMNPAFESFKGGSAVTQACLLSSGPLIDPGCSTMHAFACQIFVHSGQVRAIYALKGRVKLQYCGSISQLHVLEPPTHHCRRTLDTGALYLQRQKPANQELKLQLDAVQQDRLTIQEQLEAVQTR